jgi:hypothetical protein
MVVHYAAAVQYKSSMARQEQLLLMQSMQQVWCWALLQLLRWWQHVLT